MKTLFIILITFVLSSCSFAIKGAAQQQEVRALQEAAELGYQWGHTRPCIIEGEQDTMVWEYGDRIPTGVAVCGHLTIRTLSGDHIPFHKD